MEMGESPAKEKTEKEGTGQGERERVGSESEWDLMRG
jgi:hypothetical protein